MLLMFLAAGCGSASPITAQPDHPAVHLILPEATCTWEWGFDPCPDFNSSMPAYGLPLQAEELMNGIPLLEILSLSELPAGLLENGFSVSKASWLGDEPVRAFSTLRNDRVPVYVSSGIVLHLLHIFFDQSLAYLEEEYLLHDLATLVDHLYMLAMERDDELSAAYLAVGASLLSPSFDVDPSIALTVSAELDLIESASGFAESPIFGYYEDYSQYIPRGHYDSSERLSRYFLASMWFGRMTFILHGGEPYGENAEYLVSEERAMEQTCAALAIAADMKTDAPGEITLGDVWERIYGTTTLFAGFSDDLSVPEYSRGLSDLTGLESLDPGLLDRNLYNRFIELVDSLYAPPAIYSGTGESGLPPGGYAGELAMKTMGFRLLGQRYAPDSQILGSLVFPAVGASATGDLRTMPTGLDVAAVMGSAEARDLLEELDCFAFERYWEILTSLEDQVASFGPEAWHSTLYMSWLGLLRMGIEPLEEGYPTYMLTSEWGLAGLSRFLSSWAMLRHDTILYIKQSYTAQTISMPPSRLQPSAGFVEPLPQVYHEAAGILAMLSDALDGMEMLDAELAGRLDAAGAFVLELRDISIQELEGVPLSGEQASFLGSIPALLLSLVEQGAETEQGSETSLVADVHTDQNTGEVLEVASGNLDLMTVVFVRPDGRLEAAAGPVLSYYELTVPQSARLTDREWREMLSSGVARPWWTERYIHSPFAADFSPVHPSPIR